MKNFFTSSWLEPMKDPVKGEILVRRTATYVRPKRNGEIKGKLNIKAAKRARVKAWKAEKETA